MRLLTLESIAVISALEIGSVTFPYHFAYATRVSGWLDMYIRRNPDLSATGSDIASITLNIVNRKLSERHG